MHSSDSSWLAKVLVSQAMHKVAPTLLYLPTPHVKHMLCPAYSVNLPAGQTLQEVSLTAFTVVEYLPAMHDVQKVPVDLYVPALHATHGPSLGPPYPSLH